MYLYPKPMDFQKSIDGFAALVKLDVKMAIFDLKPFVSLKKSRNWITILYREHNGFCLWLKPLESEHSKTSPDATDVTIILSV